MKIWLVWALALLPCAPVMGGDERMPTIEEVKARHEREFLALPGVVSVGIGRDAGGRPVIIVGLDRERPQTVAALPQSVEGYPVRSQIVGEIRTR